MMKTKHFHSSRGCLSYVTYDQKSAEAALIDPSTEIGTETYLDFLKENGLLLKYVIETHTHADHISVAKEMKRATGAGIVRHQLAPSPAKDVSVVGNESLTLGDEAIRVLATPGHTNESIALFNGSEVFTGDALLIGGTGRTDFQLGDSRALYQSLHYAIENLPAETLVRPGHDYKGRNQAVLSDELHKNPRMMMGESEFVQFMDAHHPPKPELFDQAIGENSQ
jgi:glyoxylase-like metal-dependent hydrolase (beta-lactamase superfamily II)